MDKTIVAALIGAGATLLAAVIGVNVGKSIEVKNTQTQINNIFGEGNNVTINDVAVLMEDYKKLQTENDLLMQQNAQYFDDLSKKNEELERLKIQIDDIPILEYKNLALSMNGEDISINENNSVITVNGQDYFSKEITESLLSDNQNLTIKDNTIFIGKVIADKASLNKQWVLDKSNYCTVEANTRDSYGNVRANALYFDYFDGKIIYNLNKQYTYLKCAISICESCYLNSTTILTIKADEETVYTIELNKQTEPFVQEIPINNCSLLTIECDSNSGGGSCIISDAVVYN